nr:MAG TPA: hypothetical protein [Bacteriophage sp.]
MRITSCNSNRNRLKNLINKFNRPLLNYKKLKIK